MAYQFGLVGSRPLTEPHRIQQKRRAKQHKQENLAIDELRTGEYKDCTDLLDFHQHVVKSLPIITVPRPDMARSASLITL
jgi:hypothetical protein